MTISPRTAYSHFKTLGLRFSTATLGAMAAVGLDRVSAGTTGPLRFRGDSGRQGRAVGAYKEERSGGTAEEDGSKTAKAKEAQAGRPVARRKASGTVEGERTAAAHSCGFALTKSLFSQSWQKKSLRSNLWVGSLDLACLDYIMLGALLLQQEDCDLGTFCVLVGQMDLQSSRYNKIL